MNAMNPLKQALSRMMALAGVLAISASTAGCLVVVDDDDPYGPYNSAPYFVDSELYVNCGWDSYYQEYRWDFQAFVDDPDGPLDVHEVYVDVVDTYIDPTGPVESWNLVYDGNGWWSNYIYEQYSGYLTCEYYYDYEFDFWAIDTGNATDSVTYVPYY